MDIAKAKDYYSLGVLKGFDIVRDGDKWLLAIEYKTGSDTIHRARGGPKLYATIDGVVIDIQHIMGGANVDALHVGL